MIILDNIDIFILNKGKTFVFTNSIEVYNKKAVDDEIYKLIAANVQLMIDKIEIEKVRVNLEADRTQLFGKKNSLVVKREEFRVEIVVLNVIELFNVSIYGH